MSAAYELTVNLTRNGATRYMVAGAQAEARGELDGAQGWYELAALNAPLAPEPKFSLGALFLRQQKAGEAEMALRQAIALRPEYVDAHLNLGAALHQQGKLTEAISCYERALQLRPIDPNLQYNLGMALYQIGDFASAAARFRNALEQGASDAGIHYQLGIALYRLGDTGGAIAQCELSLVHDQAFAPAHLAIGDFLAERGDTSEAIAHYRRALVLNPQFAEVYSALGRALAKQQDLAGAAQCFEQALALNPRDFRATFHLGLVLEKAGDKDGAADLYERSLQAAPEFALAHCALGRLHRGRQELPKALARFERALALAPNLPEAHLGIADTFELQGQFARAISRYERVIALDPARAEAHAALGTALLRQGEFELGWREYEWRLMLEARTFEPPADIPRWNGQPLNGDRILLCAEQGFGDALQFVRYVPLIAAMGGRIVLEVRDELRSLMSTMPGLEHVGFRDEAPRCRWHCPLMSLPLVLGTRLDSIPSTIPYLFEDGTRPLDRARLSGGDFRVGLCWAGNPAHKQDRQRSLDVSAWERLSDVPGVRFFSLQQGTRGLDETASPRGMAITDLTQHIRDFADTAAALVALDLVITVDTAVAHLAGAMGKQVWILLPHVADWRWLVAREDSPWYPTARLFRQQSPGDWRPVLDRVAGELRRQVARRGRRSD